MYLCYDLTELHRFVYIGTSQAARCKVKTSEYEQRKEARKSDVWREIQRKILLGIVIWCGQKRHREARHQAIPRLGNLSQALALGIHRYNILSLVRRQIGCLGCSVFGRWHGQPDDLRESCVKKKRTEMAWLVSWYAPYVPK